IATKVEIIGMGMLVDGVWQDDVSRTKDGQFIRPIPSFRNWVTPDGSAGPSGEGGFAAESGRYHLYVSLACPWAHRTVIFRKLKGLENVISLSVVSPDMLKDGWTFNKSEGSTGDDVNGKSKLSEIYLLTDPRYSGRVSVPVLWDKKRKTIVNNESPEIIRMLNSAFNAFTNIHTDYYPEKLRPEIDRINDLVYPNINNGVYRAGFATAQAVYEAAFRNVFDTFDEIEQMLSQHRYLVGNTITEADWRLFPTLIRFDAVYYSHFKCNWRHITEYPNLSNYVRDLYQVPGVAETVSLAQIKRHYYFSQRQVWLASLARPRERDLSLRPFDFAAAFKLCQRAVERFVGKPEFGGKILERAAQGHRAAVGVELEIMPHTLARGADIALLDARAQVHHLMRQRRAEGLRGFRVLVEGGQPPIRVEC